MLAAALAGADATDTFANKATGEVFRGYLVARAGDFLYVKDQAGEMVTLKADEWDATLAPRPETGPTTRSTVPRDPPDTAPAYLYRGRPRTEAWFNRQYETYRGRLAVVDGRVVDCADPRGRRVSQFQVDRVIGPAEVLARRCYWTRSGGRGAPQLSPAWGGGAVILTGRSAADLKVGDLLHVPARFLGMKDFDTERTGTATLAVYRIPPAISKADFARLLRGGYVLLKFTAEPLAPHEVPGDRAVQISGMYYLIKEVPVE